MKVKIFVPSCSGIDYVTHSQAITSLPDRICFAKNEVYDDASELSADSFFMRYKNDKTVEDLEVLPCTEDTVLKLIDQAKGNGYKKFFFIIPSDNKEQYMDLIDGVKVTKPDENIVVYDSCASFYPLAYMAVEADKLYKKDSSDEEVRASLELIKNGFKIYIYSPQNDVLNTIEHLNYQDVISHQASGKITEVDSKGSYPIKISKGVNPLETMMDEFLGDISMLQVLPFVFYSNKFSTLNEAIKQRILQSYKLKNIKAFQISPLLGTIYGENAVGIGYIRKDGLDD